MPLGVAIIAGMLLLSGLQPAALAQQRIPVATFSVKGFELAGDNPLPAGVGEAVLAEFAGEYSGVDGLLAAADAVEAELTERGFGFHRVILPPQTLEGGVVRLDVIEFKLSTVEVEGAEFVSDTNVRRALPSVNPGAPPNTRRLARDLRVANQHPSRRLGVTFKESEEDDALTAAVKVDDSRPWQVFGSFTNIGTKESSRPRLTGGVLHSNLWGRDHAFSGSYSTSPERPEDVSQYGLTYSAPIYSYASRVSGFFVSSDIAIGEVGGIDISGAGEFYGLSLTHSLLRRWGFEHDVTVSLQNRLFENSSSIAGIVLSGAPKVRSAPFSLGYSTRGRYRDIRIQAAATYSVNTGWGDNNNEDAYRLTRNAAEDDFQVLRFAINASAPLPNGFSVRTAFDSQVTGQALITGEQFGLGGANSVRGFEERALTGDSGLQGTLEVSTPSYEALRGLRMIGFLDTGYRHVNDPAPGQNTDDMIASMGFGFRWRYQDKVGFALDWAQALADGQVLQSGDPLDTSKWHVTIVARY